MRALRLWIGLARVLLPIWLAIYFIGFRGFWAVVFIPLVAAKGIWWSTLAAFLVYGVWGTGFYILILRGRVFERAKERLIRFQPKGNHRFLVWLRENLARYEGQVLVSPFWTLMAFVVGGILTGVLVVRFSYPSRDWRRGMLLIWAGSAVEVLTWFLPLYGGLFSLVRAVLAHWFGI